MNVTAASSRALLAWAPILWAPILGAGADLQRFREREAHMGSRVEIVLYATDEVTARAAFSAAFERAAELDRIMSDYKPDSELSRLSKSSPTAKPVRLSEDLLLVLTQAQKYSEISGGAFDVTVGPLTRLWRRARRRVEMPHADRLAMAKSSVGFRHLQIDPAAGTARLNKPHMRLDLGGIAKGFAADAMLLTLEHHGIRHALVNAGGDVAMSAAPPGETGWKVRLMPLGPDQKRTEFLLLANAGVATSGDAWQYVEIEGVRYSHILDPRTGLGTTRRGGVTVVARNGMTADSIASALSVLDVEEGARLLKGIPGTSAMFVWLEGESRRERRSPDFPPTVAETSLP